MPTEEMLILRNEELGTPTDLSAEAVRDISGALNALLATETTAAYVFGLAAGLSLDSLGETLKR